MLLWNVFVQVLLPILVMFSAGWIMDRRHQLDLKTLVRLNIYLFTPSFIFVHIVESHLTAGTAAKVVAFTVVIILGMALLSVGVGRAMGYTRPQTRSLQLATMFYNSGNYGVPLMVLSFPATGPMLQVFIIVATNVSTFTIGLFLASSAHRTGWRALLPVLRQVSLWAVGAALLVRWFHVPVQSWRWLWVPLEYFSNVLIGLALVTLGAQISKAERPEHPARLGWALGLRLLGGPLLAWALVGVFGFTGEPAKIMILSSAFPTAVNTALIAHEFDADPHFAAQAVFASTLVSMLTVTVIISVLQSV